MTEPRWATPAEAAEELRVSSKTIRRWITDGTIRAERMGPRLLRVDLNSLATTPVGGTGR